MTEPVFDAGEPSIYPPKIDTWQNLPEEVAIATIVASPKSHRDLRVTLRGCGTTDSYHGSTLSDSSAHVGIAMFGGSDDIGDQPFDWTRQRVCGAFVGVIRWKPTEVPLAYLCPDLCFDSEGTVESRVVSSDDER